ncbi:prolyl-tRNA synthetase [Desulfurispirillum indicum S5]|uniref:Proline--tRNA ligase n=1 Tax=Desulfurispirillum indicum (strain ATCC BAA-1389 / DSM 22839 / S5) TaxID=653733 RepID=E6W1Y6_DESIS|nr:proline--tRNA ligase [Desulfurispirillum indicum]ADU66612.1 prolyl-tRNA synthetase [Desulfurispirillum indicum S5]
MRYSQAFLFTAKETPSDAEVISHQLMLRGGYIKKTAAGIYSYLPLAWRVLRKIENIIREEMTREGAEELMMPAALPAELWMESGRWQKYGPELLRFQDRHGRDFCIGPTHEEAITDIVRHAVSSYRHLPKNLYQIQTKFRDEIRPRFGLMRGREFIMKDGYSFDVDDEASATTYEKMYRAYSSIFRRCGLSFKAVEADSGQIGGSFSHEFMVLANSGEDGIASCSKCSYAANLEKAFNGNTYQCTPRGSTTGERVSTPGLSSMEQLSEFFGLPAAALVKSVAFMDEEGTLCLGFVRGDREVNQVKLERLSGKALHAADGEALAKAGVVAGYMGPINLPADTRYWLDPSLRSLDEIICGAGEADFHLRGLSPAVLDEKRFADISTVIEGDCCPRCHSELNILRGIEVGHVFRLGTVYSQSMKATYLDRNGKEQPMVMGCYGIGVGRTAAAAIEQNHDDKGIIWPMSIAPYQVVICTVNPSRDEQSRATADSLYERLAATCDVLYDDRDERPGVKFIDSELIGIPLRLTISQKTLEQSSVEITIRKSGEKYLHPLETISEEVARLIQQQMEACL